MIIAAVLNENHIITPIVEGEILRLYDVETKKYTDFENPATQLTEGRRGATLAFAIDKGASGFITPPETFCDLSYEKAKQEGIQFYKVRENVSFETFETLLEQHQIQSDHELPQVDIVPSVQPKV